MEKKYSQFWTIEKKIVETKQEIKDIKKWRTALMNEYCKARTFKYHQEKNIVRTIKQAEIMIKHNQVILQEYQDMLKELKDTEKNKKYN